ncbi:MAG TPA: ribose 5-phosphate isomerase B [Candidatus Omnitrophota bacterium]|nr:ribose 5-phosphate isomerase B [Candidatus Omnitrophota bacterium]HPB67718.1 ribose 5-phosphate isomerase B [Candidatus Omnitrophota bacterium]HQO58429.1 ribose 5-phosphate isomerase B [Candidatus Omnitrophota bacterium]HQP11787.1 ribose 5-phosphate isomerase B [Candidatus Omnitrophota bacterium]
MKIFIAADHRGFHLKQAIKTFLQSREFEVCDEGCYDEGVPCDYPELSCRVACAVSQNPGTRGILVCMTGIGHVIAANKVPGAYAALCYNKEAAVLSREHNNANILVLGARFVPESEIPDIVLTWLQTPFEGGRHQRRVEKIQEIEKKFLKT